MSPSSAPANDDEAGEAGDAPPVGYDPVNPPRDPNQRTGVLTWIGRGLVAIVVIGSFGVWGYRYSGYADRPPPDLLEDPSFGTYAEGVCSQAMLEVDAVPNALVATDEVDRAGQIRQATDFLSVMVTSLEAAPATERTPRDEEIISGWLHDWRTYVNDRYAYADALEQDPMARFLLSADDLTERPDRRITRLADTNGMPSCGTPGDVG